MPCKRRAKLIPPINIPNFDDIMNFPLTVMVEEIDGYKKKMYMDGKLNLISVNLSGSKKSESTSVKQEDFDSDKENDLENSINYEVKSPRKSILKPIKDKKENVGRTTHSRVMFSSPLIKNSPNGQSNLRKELLLKQLQKCQETPILPSRSIIPSAADNDSLNFLDYSPKTSLTAVGLVPIKVNNTQNQSTMSEDMSFQVVKAEDRKKWLLEAKRRSRWIRRTTQGVNDSFWDVFHADDSESVILKLCATQAVQPFSKIFPTRSRKQISKIGEGSFGEVFSIQNTENEMVVVKFIPVEGDLYYNGGPQTTFDDVIAEIVVGKELSDISLGKLDKCRNFVQIKSVSMACGRFPAYFQKEWDKSNKLKTSENDNPKKFASSQKWIIMQFEFSGCPLENFKVGSWNRAYSILIQTSLALACAETYLEFEHRDLHVGNLLILERSLDEPDDRVTIAGRSYSTPHHGVLATVIDFTFSRIRKGNNIVYTNMAKDKDIFLGTGDIQFDVYRQMQAHNRNEWKSFNPKTNIHWLIYLGAKMAEMPLEGSGEHEEQFRRLLIEMSSCDSAMELVRYHVDKVDS